MLNTVTLPLPDGVVIGKETWPNLYDLYLHDSTINTESISIDGANQLTEIWHHLDEDRLNGEEEFQWTIANCAKLKSINIAMPIEVNVELIGDLPALSKATLNPSGYGLMELDHTRCNQHPVRSYVELFMEDEEIPLNEFESEYSRDDQIHLFE